MGYEFYRHNQVKYETPFLFPPVGGKNLILFEFFSPFGEMPEGQRGFTLSVL